MKKSEWNYFLPGLGLLTGSYSDVKCERSYNQDDKKTKIIFPLQETYGRI